MEKQRTIQREASVEGIGLHTAHKAKVTFKPADTDAGITFVRTDLPARPSLQASTDFLLPVSRSPRRTSIGNGTVEVQTIEHLMATFAGAGIDNITVEIDNDEVPGLDGSSVNFLEKLKEAGIREQEKERKFFVIKEPIFVQEEDAFILALPYSKLKISYLLSYDHPFLSAQFSEFLVSPENFQKELAGARTFCLQEEAVALQNQGFGKGANYENTLVVGRDGVIKNKLRYEDEFIRHKVLDLLGDLYILGQHIRGHIVAIKSGHYLNLKLVKKLNEQMRRYSSSAVKAHSYNHQEKNLDRQAIMQILPHRDPFLFVDEIIHLEEGKRAVGLKRLSKDDYFFKGHFPGKPVMPGVLIIETMAQVGGVMMLSAPENRGKIAYFMAIDNAKFRKTVLPGDELRLEVEVVKLKSRTGLVHAKAFLEDKLAAEADLMFALAEA